MMGVPGLPPIGPDPETEDFEVWPDNVETLRVFLALETQWNTASGLGGGFVTGINYPSILAVFELYGIEDRRAMFDDLRAMELAARTELNKRG